jgi:hypothetical protein
MLAREFVESNLWPIAPKHESNVASFVSLQVNTRRMRPKANRSHHA